MEKIELKHLAPYLPYGLLFKSIFGGKVKMIGLTNELVIFNIDNDCEITDSLILEFANKEQETKPILRPLSDLTKEIEGVIPIKELYNILRPYEKYKNFSNNRKSEFYTYCKRGGALEWFEVFKEESVSFHVVAKGEKKLLHNQLNAYNKLFEFHFDVFGLIDKNLAIDINTLNQ